MSPINLEKAALSLGGSEILRSTAEMFLRQTDEMLDELRSAVDSGQMSLVKEKAHWIKGSLVYLHATPSAERARKLERATNLGASEVQNAFAELEGEVENLRAALEQHLAFK